MMSSVPSTLESRRNHPVQGSTRVVSPVGSSHRQAADTNTDIDRELLESLRLGEPAAAEYLITRYGGRAYGLAVRICGNVQDAEEAVQDAFWSVVRNVASFRGEGAFSSWLYRIVVNAAHQKLRDRRGGRTDVYLDAVLPCFDEDGRHVAPMNDWSVRLEDRSVHAELRMILTSALEELPAAGRTAVVLHHVEGMSSREIAEALNISVANVKSRLHRARLFLRKRRGTILGTASPQHEKA